MKDYSDARDAWEALEREVVNRLRGDDGKGGLYRVVFSAQSWDALNVIRGKVLAYEDVINTMHEIVRRINDDSLQTAGKETYSGMRKN